MRKNQKQTYGTIARTVLTIIGISGIIVVGAIAPNLFQLAVPLLRQNRQKPLTKKAVDQALRRLIKRGMIRMEPGTRGWRVVLTQQGLDEWHAYELGIHTLKRPKRWDKKWRLLIFDIPEQRQFLRLKIRRLLSDFGFVRLQDSVWAFPYECQEVLELLRTDNGVRHDALYVRAEHVDKDQWLKKHFQLK